MNRLRQDIQFTLRQLRRSPGFAAVMVLTLALGIGVTAAVFSLTYQVLLRPLPVSHPEQLYKVGKENECCVDGGLQNGGWRIFSYDLYRHLRDHTPGTGGVAAVQAGSIVVAAQVAGSDGAIPLNLRMVSGNYFDVLGVQPFAGRLLGPEDDRTGAPPVAVISYPLWQTKFHGAPNLVGSTLMLSGHPATIVGITARHFLGERNMQNPPGLWMPLSQEPELEPSRKLMTFPGSHWLDILVRVPQRAQVPAVEAALQRGLQDWIRANRATLPRATDEQLQKQTTNLVSASGGINELGDDYGTSLQLLLGAAGFVLLIACANLANLLLVRGMGRYQELNVRSALGAPRGRLVRQLLVEAVVLSLLGGAVSIAVGYAGTRAILSFATPNVDVTPLHATPSLPVLGFCFGLALVTGVLFGILPAWLASRCNPAEALRGAHRSTQQSSALPQRLLVISQAALSLALLSSAGLFLQSMRALEHQDFHFQPESRLIAFLDLESAGYTAAKLPALYQSIDQAFTGAPGIVSFAYSTYGPMAENSWNDGVSFPGGDPNANNSSSYTAISPQYFDAIGARIIDGRAFNQSDTATSRNVAIVSQSFAEHYLKGKRAVGSYFGPDSSMTSEYEIVGVAEDTKYRDPSDPARPIYFTPMTQTTDYSRAKAPEETKKQVQSGEEYKHFATNLIVHYNGSADAAAKLVREKLKQIDPQVAILRMPTYSEQVSKAFTQQHLVVELTAIFGALALTLAAIGLYGVTTFSVGRRTGEIGVRMALGATRAGVLGLVLRGALKQVLLGMLLGLPAAYAAARLLQHNLYQTGAFQPAVLLAACLLLLVAAALAALAPARRAASVQPSEALRQP